MRCDGDSCRETKRPEAAHGLHVSSTFYYLENRPSLWNLQSLIFNLELRIQPKTTSYAALIESAANITTATAELAVNVGRESCNSTTDSAV